MFPFFFFQTEATKESDMFRYLLAPEEGAAARWNEVYARFLPLTATVWTEEQAAPMEDGALPCVLNLSVKQGNPRYTTDGFLVIVWFRDGYATPLVPWERCTRKVPAGSYDTSLMLAGDK